MRKILFPAFFAVLWIHSSALANPKNRSYSDKDEVQVVEWADCSQGSDKRRLEIHTNGPGCTLQYYKFKKVQEIAVSRNGVDLCRNVLEKTSKNLADSGYKCEKH